MTLEKMEPNQNKIEKEVNLRDLIFGELEKKFGPEEEITTIDGLSVEHIDKKNPAESWRFNVRSSNTEPKLRLNVEAKSQELMQRITSEVLDTITEIASRLGKAGEVEGLETVQTAEKKAA